ncbi:MAG: hypothetical protein PGN13_14120 [Patulibacter minatonensis]
MPRLPLPTLPPLAQHVVFDLAGKLKLDALHPVRTGVSRFVTNRAGYTTTLRPRPLSMVSDYTSWLSLTDRTYSGRHLPPVSAEENATRPPLDDVLQLFRRQGEMTRSTDTSVLFMFFAQWFTDSFLRTDPYDHRKNDSNHEIDLCQIYGTRIEQTDLLRSRVGGRLKSQLIDGQEYPEFLFEPREPAGTGPLVFKPEFEGLHNAAWITDRILVNAPEVHKDTFFAVGLEHGNSTIGNTTLNVVFIREHNRIAGLLEAEHPAWDDERLFQTTRNIMIVMLLRIVVEEYIVHIAPFDFPLEMVPLIADGERWNRTNWAAVEFNLLYRWHSLVPDTIGTGPDALDATQFKNNNPLVIGEGIEALVTLCSGQPAARIGLRNTPTFLADPGAPGLPSVEQRTLSLMREARLPSYNAYREAYHLDPIESIDELTSDPELRTMLTDLYGDIDHVEWYVGIFAEDYPDYMMMGELVTAMVANDAFTQALSNPLLARHIFDDDATFSPTGRTIIDNTRSIAQIIARNAQDGVPVVASFKIDD